MKYFTKEWYELMQKTELTAGLRKVPDKEYTKKDIEALYQKALKREMAAERRDYNTAPDFSFMIDVLEGQEFDPNMWAVLDAKTGQPRPPKDKEEVLSYIKAEQEASLKEFEARPPFDAEDFRQYFREVYDEKRRALRGRLESDILDKVDRRLLALDCVPESVYAALKEEEKQNRKAFNKLDRRARRFRERLDVPEELLYALHLHDADLLSIKKNGRDLELIFCTEGMEKEGEKPFRKLVFKNAKVLQKDRGISLRLYTHDHDDCGCGHDHHHHEDCVHSNCVFITAEIHPADKGYEFHMLLWMPSDLKYLTVRAEELVCVDGVSFPEE